MKNDEKRRDSATAAAVPDAGGTAVLEAVSSLMEERRRFENWLAALDARRATTPEHVFSRVHADYSTRLNSVIGQLTTHADGLRRELESLTKRLGVLRDERQRAEDARAEAELRAHVGELSGDDWTTLASASDASLKDIGERHLGVEHELARTRELLDAAERPAQPAAPEEPVAEVAPEPVAPAAPVPSAVAAAPAPEPAAPAAGDAGATTARRSAATAQRNSVGTVSAVTEAAPPVPAARASVPAQVVSDQPSAPAPVPTPGPAPAPVPPAASPEPAAAQQSLDIVEHVMPNPARATPHPSPNAIPSRNSSFDELAFLSSVVDTPTGSMETPPADMPDEMTRRDTFARQSQEEAVVNLTESGSVPIVPPPKVDYEREPDSILSSGSNRALSRDSTGVDGAKTLKCSECSAMNYPTEWYCERCGAELASL